MSTLGRDGDLTRLAPQGRATADEGGGQLKVLGIAVDPLAAVAALGDGVELFGAEVTRFSHG